MRFEGRQNVLGLPVLVCAEIIATLFTRTSLGFHFCKGTTFMVSFKLLGLICVRLVRTGAAMPFTAFASSPTVTMPRIKAITTGSIPSFLDAILNLAESDTTSTLATQDNWPLQLKIQSEGRLAMFGDDTWLKLFPGLFDRSDGTTSFFVSVFRPHISHVGTQL